MPYLHDNAGDAEHRKTVQHHKRKGFQRSQQLAALKTDRHSLDRVYAIVQRHLEQRHPQAALHALSGAASGSTDVRLQNAKGVCLMRLGQPEKAVALYRPLVLTSYVALRADVPLAAKLNFAAALFLANKVTGCVDVLREIGDEQHPTVIALRAAIHRWKRALNWRERLIWLMGAQPDHAVTMDFTPGELI